MNKKRVWWVELLRLNDHNIFFYLLSTINLSSECRDEFSSLYAALYLSQDMKRIDPTMIVNKPPFGTFELEKGTNCNENKDCKRAALASSHNLLEKMQTIKNNYSFDKYRNYII